MVYDPVKRKEYYEKNKEKEKERYEKNKEKKKEYNAKQYEKNKEKFTDYQLNLREDRKQNAIDSISTGEIHDKKKWNIWCNEIKRHAKDNKYPYSEDFTNDVMFDMMVRGCFYCGDIATTIDRIDSKLDHIIDNCVGCCHRCNNSKGVADPSTFIRKAYYRARGEYYDDDTNIWFVNKNKPSIWDYKKRAKNKGVSFELSNDFFEILIKGNCEYCNRSPITWFGIDRVIPSRGYVNENIVSCCWDCNLDKREDDIETMMKRNGRIADRMDIRKIINDDHEKMILRIGISPTIKKVCARGQVYARQSDASSALKRHDNYVNVCIKNDTYPDVIFEISDEFYEEYKNSNEYITKTMFIGFDHYYTNYV